MTKKYLFLIPAVALFCLATPSPARAVDQHVKDLYQHYYNIIYTMAEDKLDGIDKQFDEIKKLLDVVEKDKCVPEGSIEEIRYTLTLIRTDNLYNLRNTIHLLSFQLKYMARADDTIETYPVRCTKTPADWLQGDNKKIRNPYLGPDGESCGQYVRVNPIKKAGSTSPLPPLEK